MVDRIKSLLLKSRDLTGRFDWTILLLVRLSVGWLFFESGRGKLFERLGELQEYFVELGIPFPHEQAAFAAATELVGGALLILGLGTRLICIPLAIIMVVAIITAHLPTTNTVGDFLYLAEVNLFLIFVWMAFTGPGRVSLDHYLAPKLGLGTGDPDPA